MIKKLIANIIARFGNATGSDQVISFRTNYAFRIKQPTHYQFAVVSIGQNVDAAIQSIRDITVNNDIKAVSCELSICTVVKINGTIIYNNKAKLLRILKDNHFHAVVLTPSILIGHINNRAVLVEADTDSRIRLRNEFKLI